MTIQSLNPLRKKKSVILGIEWDEFMGGEDIWATSKITDSFFVRTTLKLNAISPSSSMITSNLVWVYVCDYLLLQAGQLSQGQQQLVLGGTDTDIAHQGLPHKCCHRGWGDTLGWSYIAAFSHSDNRCSVMHKDDQKVMREKRSSLLTGLVSTCLIYLWTNLTFESWPLFLWLVEFGRQELRSWSQQGKSQGM